MFSTTSKSRKIYEKLTKIKREDDDDDVGFKDKNNGQVILHKIFSSFSLVQAECVVCVSFFLSFAEKICSV